MNEIFFIYVYKLNLHRNDDSLHPRSMYFLRILLDVHVNSCIIVKRHDTPNGAYYRIIIVT